jgi:hypothetical protein
MSQQNSIALFLGPHLSFSAGSAIPTIKKGDKLESKHFDNIILFGHGNVTSRNTKEETHRINLLSQPAIFENSTSSITEVIKIMEATTPKHIDLVSCFGGALGEDLQRSENFDRIAKLMNKNGQKDLTISVLASSKHATMSTLTDRYVSDIIDNDSKDLGMHRVKLASNYPETLKQYHIHINEQGKASLIGFKIRAPKNMEEIAHPEKFIGSHTEYGDKVENKSTRHAAQIVTEVGKDDPNHDKLLKDIQSVLLQNGAQYSSEYIRSAISVAATREKPELLKQWASILQSSEEKYLAISQLLREEINFGNPELVRALIDTTPIDKRNDIIEDLVLRKAPKEKEVAASVMSVITRNEKIETLYHVLTRDWGGAESIAENMRVMLSQIDVNTKDNDGNTIMHRAMLSEKIVPALPYVLDNPKLNIDINAKNNAGQTIMDLANPENKKHLLESSAYIKYLSEKVQFSKIEEVQKLFIAGANPNSQDDMGRTMINLAAGSYSPERIDMLKLLLSAGSDITALNKAGDTALARAQASHYYDNEHEKLVSFLKDAEEHKQAEKSAQINLPLNSNSVKMC